MSRQVRVTKYFLNNNMMGAGIGYHGNIDKYTLIFSTCHSLIISITSHLILGNILIHWDAETNPRPKQQYRVKGLAQGPTVAV